MDWSPVVIGYTSDCGEGCSAYPVNSYPLTDLLLHLETLSRQEITHMWASLLAKQTCHLLTPALPTRSLTIAALDPDFNPGVIDEARKLVVEQKQSANNHDATGGTPSIAGNQIIEKQGKSTNVCENQCES